MLKDKESPIRKIITRPTELDFFEKKESQPLNYK